MQQDTQSKANWFVKGVSQKAFHQSFTHRAHTTHYCALPRANQLWAQLALHRWATNHLTHDFIDDILNNSFILIILRFVVVIKNKSAHYLFVPCPKISLVSSTGAFDPIPLHPNMIKEKTCLPIANTKWFFNN